MGAAGKNTLLRSLNLRGLAGVVLKRGFRANLAIHGAWKGVLDRSQWCRLSEHFSTQLMPARPGWSGEGSLPETIGEIKPLLEIFPDEIQDLAHVWGKG